MARKCSADLLDKTKKAWQPLSPTPLSQTELEEIIRNMLDLCRVLLEIDQAASSPDERR
jgi:hypothetical protein